MAGRKYVCGVDGSDCTIESYGICMKLCDTYARASATNNPGTCGYRKSLYQEQRRKNSNLAV